jgi:uncharacterized membrane protein (DUF441 family)
VKWLFIAIACGVPVNALALDGIKNCGANPWLVWGAVLGNCVLLGILAAEADNS